MRKILNTKLFFEVANFFSVGLTATLVHYLCMFLLIEVASIKPTFATCTGYITGAAVSYLLNYKITFKSKEAHAKTAARFALSTVAGFILNAMIVLTGTELMGFSYVVSQIVSTGLVFFINFSISKTWTFRKI